MTDEVLTFEHILDAAEEVLRRYVIAGSLRHRSCCLLVFYSSLLA